MGCQGFACDATIKAYGPFEGETTNAGVTLWLPTPEELASFR